MIFKQLFEPVSSTYTYLLGCEETGQAVLVDPVINAMDRDMQVLQELGLRLAYTLDTHIHADHITAASYIREQLGGKIAISRHMLDIIKTWTPIFQTAQDTPADGAAFDHLFANDETFTIGDIPARIIHTPGHTPADTTYIIGDAVFVGDVIFLPDVGSGRCDFPGGSAEDSYDSSRKLFALPEHYRIYVGHDYPPEGVRGPQCMATVAEQKERNIRLHEGIDKASFVSRRKTDDTDKAVPALLLPSIQANMRTGDFGAAVNGIQYVKLPVNQL